VNTDGNRIAAGQIASLEHLVIEPKKVTTITVVRIPQDAAPGASSLVYRVTRMATSRRDVDPDYRRWIPPSGRSSSFRCLITISNHDGAAAGASADKEPRRYLHDLVPLYPQRSGKGLRPSLCIATCPPSEAYAVFSAVINLSCTIMHSRS
jgi:hypothetical protein